MGLGKLWIWLLAIGLAAAGVLTWRTSTTEAAEVAVTLDQLPPAVRDTILREAGGATIREIEQETRGGLTVFEAEFYHDGAGIEIAIAADGTLLGRKVEGASDEEEEVAIPIDQVPEPARAALQQLAGTAVITECTREREHGIVIYEATWSAGGTTHEAEVSADGAVVEQSQVIPVAGAPAAVQAVIAKHFAKGAKVVVEMKTIVVYDVEALVDGKHVEMIVLPGGEVHSHGDNNDGD